MSRNTNRKGSDCIKTLRITLTILGIVFFLTMSVSGIYALDNQLNGKTNPVDIELDNYRDVTVEDVQPYSQGVSPGQIIPFVPKVENVGTDCYLRVRFSYINDETNFLDYISGFAGDLVLHGDYYYVEPIFAAGRTIEFFQSIQIPWDAEVRAPDGKLKIVIDAEAIQADGFEPDYTLEDPWKGVVPTENDHIIYDIPDTGEISVIEEGPKTGDEIDIWVITFVISAIGLIIIMILYAIENKKQFLNLQK